MRYLVLLAIFCFHFYDSASAQIQEEERVGLLVMAHGGSSEWNKAVLDAVVPLTEAQPTAVAFGMADPKTLQTAVNELLNRRVTRIGIVRLFMSAESFLHSTEYAFGLRDDPPKPSYDGATAKRLDLAVPASISRSGLLDASTVGGILADRALGLSSEPTEETVLIVGHGTGDDVENDIWIQRMDDLADQVRTAAPFHKVVVNTLREDWTDKRGVVEEELRSFLRAEKAEGRTVLIIPFRLFGFGPYSDVFEGLNYRADSLGFLPDPRITTWIREQLQNVIARLPVLDAIRTDSLSQ